MRSQQPGSRPAHVRSLLILTSEVARNAIAEVRWRRRRGRETAYVTSPTG